MRGALTRIALHPSAVALASGAAVIASPVYAFTRSAWFLRNEDAKAYATDAHPELPSRLAALVNEASFREALGHEFSEAAVDSLLGMPPVQLQTALWLCWVLPSLALVVVAAARRMAPDRAALRGALSLGLALLALNGLVAVNAVWMHDAGATRAALAGLRASMVHIALATAYVTVFGSLHHLLSRSTLRWLSVSLALWGALWFVRMTLRALDLQAQHWLIGGADTLLLGPNLAQVVQGLITCAAWALAASAALFLADRQRAGTRPSLSPIPRTSQGRS